MIYCQIIKTHCFKYYGNCGLLYIPHNNISLEALKKTQAKLYVEGSRYYNMMPSWHHIIISTTFPYIGGMCTTE